MTSFQCTELSNLGRWWLVGRHFPLFLMSPVPECCMLLFIGKWYSYGDAPDSSRAAPVMTEANLADTAGLAVRFPSFPFTCGVPPWASSHAASNSESVFGTYCSEMPGSSHKWLCSQPRCSCSPVQIVLIWYLLPRWPGCPGIWGWRRHWENSLGITKPVWADNLKIHSKHHSDLFCIFTTSCLLHIIHRSLMPLRWLICKVRWIQQNPFWGR